ncbi:uncharacterized protein LOC115887749 [Sitophilus oryzae]|uniref:Uncharacterized protein LOC115887749 n=1 Tax=Sitophilus oryzae TaxID=7048 RepID=A0A6J2YGG8_SITOR|nr:uncharacterized protein LOC115887749 [Sitophilus oryzae]
MSCESKQMCLCFKVFFRVLANLIVRIKSELVDVVYRMCLFCCCKRREDIAEEVECKLIRESTESFYQNVSREAAEKLLENKQNGTFIIRPSKNANLATLSLVQDCKVYHLNVRRREKDSLIALGTEKSNEKCFANLNSLINYYISNYLVLYSEGTRTLTLLLPYRDKNENYNEATIS